MKVVNNVSLPFQFDALRLAFEVVQIPRETSDAIFSVLSGILWLGNLSYQVSFVELVPSSMIYYYDKLQYSLIFLILDTSTL